MLVLNVTAVRVNKTRECPRTLSLDWRAWHCAVRAKHATVALLRFKFFTTAFADIKILASISRHLLNCFVPALGTGDYGSLDHGCRCLVSQHHPRTYISTLAIHLWCYIELHSGLACRHRQMSALGQWR